MNEPAKSEPRGQAVTGRTGWSRLVPLALGLAGMLALSGCLSQAKLPSTLLTLTPANSAAAGSGGTGSLSDAIAVIEPAVPQKLDVTRLPVQINASQVAYLKDAMWVEKPARQFRQLLAETIRAQGKRLVIDGTDRQYSAATKLSGQLLEMGYDAPSQSVLVRFEAVLEGADGKISTRRFESSVNGVAATPGQVGPALNTAANDVARQVVDWIG